MKVIIKEFGIQRLTIYLYSHIYYLLLYHLMHSKRSIVVMALLTTLILTLGESKINEMDYVLQMNSSLNNINATKQFHQLERQDKIKQEFFLALLFAFATLIALCRTCFQLHKLKEKYQNRIAGLNSQIKTLKRQNKVEVGQKQDEIKAIQASSNQYFEEANKWRVQAQERIKNREVQILQTQNHLNNYREQLMKWGTENSSIQDSIKKGQVQLERQKSTLANIQKEISHRQNLLTRCEEMLKNNQNQLKKHEEQFRSKKSQQFRRYEEQLRDKQNLLKSYEGRQKQYQKAIQKKQQTLRNLERGEEVIIKREKSLKIKQDEFKQTLRSLRVREDEVIKMQKCLRMKQDEFKQGECSICYRKFVYPFSKIQESHDKDIVATQCHHTFHVGCLRQWTRKSPTCPLDRRQLKA